MCVCVYVSRYREQMPFFHYSSGLIARFGHTRVLAAAHAVLCLRLAALATLVSAENHEWVLLWIALSHGFCFALPWTTMVDFAYHAAPPELRATSQVLDLISPWPALTYAVSKEHYICERSLVV